MTRGDPLTPRPWFQRPTRVARAWKRPSARTGRTAPDVRTPRPVRTPAEIFPHAEAKIPIARSARRPPSSTCTPPEQRPPAPPAPEASLHQSHADDDDAERPPVDFRRPQLVDLGADDRVRVDWQPVLRHGLLEMMGVRRGVAHPVEHA